MSVNPGAFRGDDGHSRAQLLKLRRMSVDSSSSSSMCNLNNFHPVYDADEPDSRSAPPHPLHVDLHAPTEDVYIPTMDELLQTPPQDSQATATITPANWNFNWNQAGSYEVWFPSYDLRST